jgi:hypoxanthine phosphoribosyltransferase
MSSETNAAARQARSTITWIRQAEETAFYGGHAWALSAFPRVSHAAGALRAESARLGELPPDWRRAEAATNVYLLACAISDTVDDWLAGRRYDFSKIRDVVPGAGTILKPVEAALAVPARLRALRIRRVEGWRESWERAVGEYLRVLVDGTVAPESAKGLVRLLETKLPGDLAGRRAKIPSAFRSQDLSHHDVLSLGAKFAAEYGDRSRPVLVAGFRTAGSYFAPLLRAFLEREGYESVDSATLRPKQGLTRRERAKIEWAAARRALVVLIDEPVNTGSTLLKALSLLRAARIPGENVVALLPVHPSRREWNRGYGMLPLSRYRAITLAPEETYKARVMGNGAGKEIIREYFERNGRRVESIAEEECLNAALEDVSERKFHSRLKKVYEVRLPGETRYVVGKSVGWGWLGYSAFLAGEQLGRFVPPMLGLRDGILYSEWIPQQGAPVSAEAVAPVAAEYIAARAVRLRLDGDPAPELARVGQHKGLDELAGILSRAYGSKMAAVLRRPRVLRELAEGPNPMPVLVDGKMRPAEWIACDSSVRKTDFEQHGQGKTELNATDPAFDLAETILQWRLSPGAESELVQRYAELSGDWKVGERLFLAKLLAGSWALDRTLDNLKDARLARRHGEFNEQYVAALDFLVEHTARYCGELVARPEPPAWKSPLVVADIDGVLDKRIFGYPSATAAGIEAVSLLHTHGFPLALNTARSLGQVKRYSEAYGCCGGVAEYGAVAWDAVHGAEQVLIGEETLAQIEQVKKALGGIPGVFVDENYVYSVKAYVYERGMTVPLPTVVVQDVLAGLGADRLEAHRTWTDTAILAREADKGRGLVALAAMAGVASAETIAIGDSEPDLPMFQAAGRSYAPGHISCRRAAQLLGCRVASRGYQPGLLEIVRSIVHPDGGMCERCRAAVGLLESRSDGFVKYLKIADRSPRRLLLSALTDFKSLEAFRA